MERPKVQVNAAAWRFGALSAGVVVLALASALIAQTTISAGADHDQKDPLATLALVLAVLAFLIQIFVYVAQSNESVRSAERGEELNSSTRQLLDEIRTTSRTTQEVQVKQFDRLLDYVVGADGITETAAAQDDVDEDEAEVGDASARPATVADIERIVLDSTRRAVRPDFSSLPALRRANQGLLDFYAAIPSEQEVEAGTQQLLNLAPLSVAKLSGLREKEIAAAQRGGSSYTLRMSAALGDWTPSTKQLLDSGIMEVVNGNAQLTQEGRRIARLTGLSATSGNVPPYVMRAVNKLSGVRD